MQFLPNYDMARGAEKKFSGAAAGEIAELRQDEAGPEEENVCCGGPPPPKSSAFARPGYVLQPYVFGFLKDERGDVAVVKTALDASDQIGTVLARLGVIRDDYRVSPGLYGVGRPNADSPVIVTANYKLSFDEVRRHLEAVDCWILVLDTCGINVWCAAGKGTFSTAELVERVIDNRLAERVNHRKLIVPQLGAPGIAGHTVKLQCGFSVVYGPVRASDLPGFLNNSMQASREMRTVTFTLKERFELIPVEFTLLGRKIWWLFPVMIFLSGIGPSLFSWEDLWKRGLIISGTVIFGGLSGALVVPLLLPWIPGRSFAVKGALTGMLLALLYLLVLPGLSVWETGATVLIFTAASSYLAMNFTGSTPYTSPSGVEKEMKKALPLQILAVIVGAAAWLISPYF